MLPACLVAVLCVWLTHGQTLNPGCSFYNGQCVYTIQMGHAGQCDATGSQDGCCPALESRFKTLQDDVTRLDAMMAEMARVLNGSSGSGHSTSALAALQQERDQLAARLQQTQAELGTSQTELNTTKAELARVLQELHRCQPQTAATTTTPPPTLDMDFELELCDFEDSLCGFTQDHDDDKDFSRTQGSTGHSGPVADHTMGSPSGHYMYVLPQSDYGGENTPYHPQVMRLTSPSYPPARAYCLQFWFHMHGTSVKDLNVYAKISSGRGNPIWSRSGDQGPGWQLGQVELDSEYTAKSFAVTFEATSISHYYLSYSQYNPGISHKDYRDTEGIIAVDDIYAYNTTCNYIPRCPVNAHVRHEGNRSSCYSFHVSPKSWRDAAKACRLLGAQSHLVSVTSQEEQTFLEQVIQADPALVSGGQYGWYAGATDERHEGTWEWTDLGTPYSGNYSAWHPGQPNNVGSSQDCLLLQYPQDHYAWGDVDCSEQHPYICEVTYSTTST